MLAPIVAVVVTGSPSTKQRASRFLKHFLTIRRNRPSEVAKALKREPGCRRVRVAGEREK
jgi:hypothetical protein